MPWRRGEVASVSTPLLKVLENYSLLLFVTQRASVSRILRKQMAKMLPEKIPFCCHFLNGELTKCFQVIPIVTIFCERFYDFLRRASISAVTMKMFAYFAVVKEQATK
jgi:hypothetical protein